LRVTIVRPADLGPAELARWHEFQRRAPGLTNPFLSVTFAQIVGGARPHARVAVVEEDGAVQAFLPFEAGPGRLGMPIGHPMNNLHCPLTSGLPLDIRHVVRRAGLRGWRFTSAPADQDVLARYHYEGAAERSLVVDLSFGYPGYLASRGRQVTDLARKRRALERAAGPVWMAWNTARREDVRQLVDWKSAIYGGARKIFADPTALEILASAAASDRPDCHGLVSVLSAGEKPVAITCNLMSDAGISTWQISYDPAYRRVSPGLLLSLALLEEAASRGIGTVDLGRGQAEYKNALANASYPAAGGAVWAFGAEAAGRRLYRNLRAALPAARKAGTS
jgi:CelD/BcsL family acetyltransferase involved in cellulose biosynthesis